MICTQCPRNCGVDRSEKVGFCGFHDEMMISHVGLHRWEEPCISGQGGSGTIFFSGCSLRCVFCQNAEISRGVGGKAASPEDLVGIFKRLEQMGAENVNLVNPTHFTLQIREALRLYKPSIPVVWNSGGYEKAETIRTLEGLADIYLPDMKYYDKEVSLRYAKADDYFENAASALREMARQVGKAQFDERGMMTRGLIVRHLVLPAHVGQTEKILRWVRDNLPDAYVSLLGQYFPAGDAAEYPEINRRLKRKEYQRAVDALDRLGIENGFLQELGSASAKYVPRFDGTY